MTSPHPHPLFREAMDLARPATADLAAAIVIPVATLQAYHAGIRPAPPAVRGALAQYLRTHAAALEAMADHLEAGVPHTAAL